MSKKAVLAFSGGLDTCWCVPVLAYAGWEVATATVDVGGSNVGQLEELGAKSKRLGAVAHYLLPAKERFFDEVLRYLIAGNVLRGGTYPLCVGAERAVQAQEVVSLARSLGAQAVAHGCTAAGNDQIRFEVAIRTLAPELEILAPVRDAAPARDQQLARLRETGLAFSEQVAKYSVNSGLWGVTIGGAETTGTEQTIPEGQWLRTAGAFDAPQAPRTLLIGFERGVPCALDDRCIPPVEVIETLDAIAGAYGIGRGIHLGETILGIKGRVAFEAPAASVLIAAHRELEKLVLTKRQLAAKEFLSLQYGDMVHEGLFSEPACRDIEAFFVASQARVIGQVKVRLCPGSFMVEGVSSPYSLHAASRAVYGEAVGEWTPEDAKGFGRIYGLASVLHRRAGGQA